MAISSQGWAFVSGSGTGATDPGGLDTNIQFNNNGAFSGSSALITDGSGSLSASLNISASSFYGDGSNLTGLTASAVNVADGPEFSIQFRRDTPISGEISGSGALVFLTASSTLSLSSSLAISGTAAGFQSSEIYFGTKAQKVGQLLVEEDNGYLFVLKSSGGIDISGSDGIFAIIGEGTNLTLASAYTNTGLTLTNMSEDVAIDLGHDGAISGSGNLTVGGTSTFNSTATFNNNASVHNQGITVNNAAATINNNLVANGNITLGNASGDGVTLNAGSITQTANQLTWKVISGSAATGSGPTQNGAILFFSSGSEGTRDLLKFHTSGTAPGTVFPQSVYLTQGAPLSGSLAGPGSYLGLDSNNKIVVTSSGAPPGGSDTQIQFNDAGTLGGDADFTWNKTTNALTIAGSTATSASSDQGLYFRAEGPDKTAGRLGDEPQLVVSGSMVGIGTATPSNSPSVDTFLDVRGHVRVGKSGTGYIFSNNDDNTFIKFGGSGVPGSDGISLFAGAKRMLVVDENASTPDAVIVGSASLETDFAVLTAMSAPNADSMSTAPALYVSGGADSVGVGTSSPLVSMDVHYTGSGNPVKLGNDTGGGHVAYFGTSSANLTAGGIYYLNKNGGWESVNSATTGSGHNQLLGVALGAKAAGNGMLLKGYFDVSSFYSGSFIKGAPVYIQSSSVLAGRPVVGGGYLSSSAPTATDSYVRVVGYGTDTPNVVYFDPDSTYIEIGS